METTLKTYYNSPIGIIEISAIQNKISGLYFVEKENKTTHQSEILEKAKIQLDEYFQGARTVFNLPLHLQGTVFQEQVWQQLLKIPYGLTKTYQDIARALGDRNALRAVGNANGKNKISIIIPCHRVIGSDGKLTGFAGGIERKKWLLTHECKYKQGSLF